MIISGLRISPDVPLEDIITFRDKHKDELGLFRTQLTELTQRAAKNIPIDALRQQMSDMYLNEFTPAYNNFKAALKSSGIKWLTDNFLKVSLLSVETTGIPLALGLTIPQALLAGVGVSLLASTVSYNVEKRQKLRENPYSYLLAVEKKFS